MNCPDKLRAVLYPARGFRRRLISAGNRFGTVASWPGDLGRTVRGGNTGLGGLGADSGLTGLTLGCDSPTTNSAWPSTAETAAKSKTNASNQA